MCCANCGDSVSALRECRNCSESVCEDCAVPDSVEATERDRPGYEGEPARAVRAETVMCATCASGDEAHNQVWQHGVWLGREALTREQQILNAAPNGLVEQLADDLTAKRLTVLVTGNRESLKSQMANRLRSQALRHAGECLQAIHRQVPMDMLHAWRRLTEAMGQTFGPDVTPWPYQDSTGPAEMVACVLANIDSIDANRHWLCCERAMRSIAERRAMALELVMATNARLVNLDEDNDERLALQGEVTACLRFAYPASDVAVQQ